MTSLNKDLKAYLKRQLAMDEQLDPKGWRTNENGQHFHIDNATGEIDAGMGGKFNGQKVDSSKSSKGSSGVGGSSSEYENLMKNVPKEREGTVKYFLNQASKYKAEGQNELYNKNVAEAVMSIHDDLRKAKNNLDEKSAESFYSKISANPEFFSSIKGMSDAELKNQLMYHKNDNSLNKGDKAYNKIAVSHLNDEMKRRGISGKNGKASSSSPYGKSKAEMSSKGSFGRTDSSKPESVEAFYKRQLNKEGSDFHSQLQKTDENIRRADMMMKYPADRDSSPAFQARYNKMLGLTGEELNKVANEELNKIKKKIDASEQEIRQFKESVNGNWSRDNQLQLKGMEIGLKELRDQSKGIQEGVAAVQKHERQQKGSSGSRSVSDLSHETNAARLEFYDLDKQYYDVMSGKKQMSYKDKQSLKTHRDEAEQDMRKKIKELRKSGSEGERLAVLYETGIEIRHLDRKLKETRNPRERANLRREIALLHEDRKSVRKKM